MAKYYYCNGTKKSNNLPCQIAVPDEYDKCHFHDGGGPGPKKVAVSTFKLLKGAIDTMVYLHAAIEASKFFFSLADYGISLYAELAGFDMEPYHDDSLLQKLEALGKFYSVNEAHITNRISLLDEEGLQHISALTNYLLLATQDDQEDDEGGHHHRQAAM